MKKITGFTLAEVLVALGIIGIISAITLTTLIKNYQKQVTVQKLKKTYNEISQAIKLSEVDNGPMSSWESYSDISINVYFEKYWQPYFINPKICKNHKQCGYNNKWPWKYIKNQNFGYGFDEEGRLNFYDNIGNLIVLYPEDRNAIYVDINGGKGPNRFGRDIFAFGFNSKLYLDSINCEYEGYGTGCAQKIINDGWKIKDDYPW